MPYTTVLLQTITTVEGEGLDSPLPLNLVYTFPQGCTAGVQYLRAGNAAGGMVNITLLKDGKVMRYFPISAGGAMHVPLSIVDELGDRGNRHRRRRGFGDPDPGHRRPGGEFF